MKSQWVMTASAVLLAVAGLAATFAPAEVLARAGITATAALVVAAQVTGALYLGFAMTNWMARQSTVGGIYNRPLAIGNFTHFFVGGMALLKAGFWIVGGVYALLALGFGALLFGGAKQAS